MEKLKNATCEGFFFGIKAGKNCDKINKSSKNRGVNNRAGADVRELINFIKTPSEQILTLSDGKTFTRDEINNNITTEAARTIQLIFNFVNLFKESLIIYES